MGTWGRKSYLGPAEISSFVFVVPLALQDLAASNLHVHSLTFSVQSSSSRVHSPASRVQRPESSSQSPQPNVQSPVS